MTRVSGWVNFQVGPAQKWDVVAVGLLPNDSRWQSYPGHLSSPRAPQGDFTASTTFPLSRAFDEAVSAPHPFLRYSELNSAPTEQPRPHSKDLQRDRRPNG